MAIVGFLVFASALAASISVFWLTLAPAVPRIVMILRDGAPAHSPTYRIPVTESRVRTRSDLARAVARPSLRAAA